MHDTMTNSVVSTAPPPPPPLRQQPAVSLFTSSNSNSSGGGSALQSMNTSTLSIATLCGRVGDVPNDPRFPRYGALVEERLDHLKRIADQLGEDLSDYPHLVFRPGGLTEELGVLIRKKEDCLAERKAQNQQENANIKLCKEYYHGRCNRGVTCGDSHTDGHLEAHIRQVVRGLLGVPAEGGDGFLEGAADNKAGHHVMSIDRRVFTVLHALGRESWSLIIKVLNEVGGFRSLVVRACDSPAAKALSACLRRNTLDSLRVLDISRNRLGSTSPTGVLKIAAALAVNTTLESLSMAYNDLGAAGCYALVEAISSNSESAITALNLAGNGIVPQDGAFGVLCGAIGRCERLKKLSLAHNHIGPEGMKKIFATLGADPTPVSNQKEGGSTDNINNNNNNGSTLPSPASHALNSSAHSMVELPNSLQQVHHHHQLQQLECLDLCAAQCGDSGVIALSQFLVKPQAAALRYLHLGWNHVTYEGILPLCVALESVPRLEVLHLSYNLGIGRKGSIGLCEFMKKCNTLRKIDLRWTSLGDDGAATIAEAMTVGTSNLRSVLLYGNELDSRTETMIVERQRKLDDAHLKQQLLQQQGASGSNVNNKRPLAAAAAAAPAVPPLQPEDLFW
ncbi:leucine-rich repeat protein, putative [Bodo saltans]|uniref:Leucine-rich repeat protein, putative n=1 Tax=Bodo saltans TaxID=75058 RepID=A0A0S4JHR1_BODSA|nr:leucine-rich repeat protein, putative [Bodo saltans]|eukprot:CUG89699.1 leucine-rich repeat protein, putative [Bodo saltans]